MVFMGQSCDNCIKTYDCNRFLEVMHDGTMWCCGWRGATQKMLDEGFVFGLRRPNLPFKLKD